MSEALVAALAPGLGRVQAQEVVGEIGRRALERGQKLARAATADERVRDALSLEAIERALDPAAYLGSAKLFIDRALDAYRALLPEAGGRA
jgi:3-carboxy-cis,cis-muconate cycloisomerase